MEREASDIRSSSGGGGGAGEPCSSEKHRCCICNKEFRTHKALCGHMRTHPRSWKGVKNPPQPHAEQQQQQQQQGRDARGSASAELSIIPVREFEEDVNPRRWESVVNQLLLLVEESRQRPQGGDDAAGSSDNNNFITSDNSTARGGGGGGGNGEVIMFSEPASISIVAAGVAAEAAAGVAADAIIAAHNGTVSDLKKKGSSSTSSSSAAAGGSGAHTCEKCGRTFAMGQSFGGHMRKHYGGPPIITNKKRTREQPDETPAPTVDALPSQSHNPPALLSQSQEEPEWSPAGNGACRLHNFIALLEKRPKNAPHPEPERKDDDELLSLRLGQFDSI